ncbi:hypothetical protein ACFYYH_12445 [Streptomyces sp. NPDC002018]|uniref:hypothetical protein n=1 Tax=Streptomyces sp. NPDC002018 TaxID=3364629 RepID=UPI00369A77B3
MTVTEYTPMDSPEGELLRASEESAAARGDAGGATDGALRGCGAAPAREERLLGPEGARVS